MHLQRPAHGEITQINGAKEEGANENSGRGTSFGPATAKQMNATPVEGLSRKNLMVSKLGRL